MRGSAIALTIHMLGLIAVFAGFAMQHRAAGRLRRARRVEEARPWAELLDATRAMVPSGAVMLLLSGAYLTARFGPNPPAWIPIGALVTVFLIATGLVLARRFRALARGIADRGGPLSTTDAERIGHPFTWALHASANGAALGTIWLMAAKPGAAESLLVVAVATIVGAIVGSQLGRRALRQFSEARA